MIFAKNFGRNYEKKILGTSDPWSMRRSSQRPSDPATQRIILKIVGFVVYEPLRGCFSKQCDVYCIVL